MKLILPEGVIVTVKTLSHINNFIVKTSNIERPLLEKTGQIGMLDLRLL